MTVEYLDLADYLAIAEEVTGLDVDTLLRVARLGLAESASALRVFIETNGWTWVTTPNVDDAERAVLAIASGGWDVPDFAEWLRGHLAKSA